MITNYIDLEKLDKPRLERLYKILEYYVGYDLPSGLFECFISGNVYKFRWCADLGHEPIIITRQALDEIGEVIDRTNDKDDQDNSDDIAYPQCFVDEQEHLNMEWCKAQIELEQYLFNQSNDLVSSSSFALA